ncbi:unnamed protein product [Dicrocoelium dendriticum]|nr:unnamed protein product [Dicrocoelium dendriticum]
MCRLVFRSTLTLLTVCICGTCVGHTTVYNSLDENLSSLFRFITNRSVISKDELDDFLGTLNLRPHAHDHEDEAHLHEENATHCYSADELFNFFPNTSGLNERQLEQILPTVVHEICTDACHHDHHEHTSDGAGIRQLGWQPILATVAAVLILCASGLIVVVILPLMSRSFYHVITQFLIALSVGSLTGDAFLHLIPHSTPLVYCLASLQHNCLTDPCSHLGVHHIILPRLSLWDATVDHFNVLSNHI